MSESLRSRISRLLFSKRSANTILVLAVTVMAAISAIAVRPQPPKSK